MKPIQTGDLCLVTSALGQKKSPNVGLIVKVVSLQGEHSQHGRIWRCSGEGVVQLSDNGAYVPTGWADFAQSWLQKIDAPKAKDKADTLELSC